MGEVQLSSLGRVKSFTSFREGKLILTSPAKFIGYPSVPAREAYMATYVLECPFSLTSVDHTSIDDVFSDPRAESDSLNFFVHKARRPEVLRPFQHPDPYTDGWKISLSHDDMMVLFLAA